jgi:pantoate--beta-alanine ligase
VVFVPEVDEVYPKDETSEPIDLQGLDISMEGFFRPGHFTGVAQVVKRLLEIVQPDALYMGQKDFQQVAVIRYLIQSFQFPTQLVMCPTLREANGLAMSSRNVRLDPEMRTRATVIYQTLKYCQERFGEMPIQDLQDACLRKLQQPDFRPEYFEIVDGITLKPADESTQYVVACCAVWAGDVRLIDNMILRGSLKKVFGIR